ncbi:hypothetical protein BH23ACT7_BH23ACT7_17720 [soil metagenome]|jgi:soluble lytic murein transglycosylase-like protein
MTSFPEPRPARRVAVQAPVHAGRPLPADEAAGVRDGAREEATPSKPGRWPVTLVVAVLVMAGQIAGGVPDADPTAPRAAPWVDPHVAAAVAIARARAALAAAPAYPAAPGSENVALAGEPATLPHTHVVAPGDTVEAVASRYGLEAPAVVRANSMNARSVLQPGEVLVLPASDVARPGTPAEALAADLPVEDLLERAAERYGVEPAVVKAVAWRESRWNQRVVSSAGAVGVMQVLPSTAEAVSEHLGRDLDPYETADNVAAGVAYLDWLAENQGGDLRAALAAYHQGPRSLQTEGPFPVTERYVDQVLELRRSFRAR